MERASKAHPRRTLLQRASLALAATLGLGATARRLRAADHPALPGAAAEPGPLVLHGRRRLAPPARPLVGGSAGERVVRGGELLDGPAGQPVGEFFASAFQLETALGAHPLAASNLEFQTFRLPEGTLFGIGAPGTREERSFAVLGGTGRFGGASGSYLERERPSGPVGAVEFVITLRA
jgi:hypothetical protein